MNIHEFVSIHKLMNILRCYECRCIIMDGCRMVSVDWFEKHRRDFCSTECIRGFESGTGVNHASSLIVNRGAAFKDSPGMINGCTQCGKARFKYAGMQHCECTSSQEEKKQIHTCGDNEGLFEKLHKIATESKKKIDEENKQFESSFKSIKDCIVLEAYEEARKGLFFAVYSLPSTTDRMVGMLMAFFEKEGMSPELHGPRFIVHFDKKEIIPKRSQ